MLRTSRPWSAHIAWAGLLLVAARPAAAQPPKPAPAEEKERVNLVVQDLNTTLDNFVAVRLANRIDDGLGAALVPADEALRAHLGLPEKHGLVVASLAPEGPAARVGLQANDILLTLGPTPLAEPGDLTKALKAGGEKAQALKFLRAGKRTEVQVKPELRVTLAPAAPEKPAYFIGVRASTLDETLRSHLQLDDQGLLVDEVIADGPAARAGLHKNDVLLKLGDDPLKATDDLVARVQASGGKPAALAVVRAGKPLNLQVTPEPRNAEIATIDLHPEGTSVVWRNLAVGPNGESTWGLMSQPLNLVWTAAGADRFVASRVHGLDLGRPAVPDRVEKRLDELAEQVKKLHATLDDLRAQMKAEAPKAGGSK